MHTTKLATEYAFKQASALLLGGTGLAALQNAEEAEHPPAAWTSLRQLWPDTALQKLFPS